MNWTTADYALIVSLCSAAVSLLSLGWNIWSKFIFPKPKVRVQVSFVLFDDAMQQILFFPSPNEFRSRLNNDNLIQPALRIYVSNFGPGGVKLGYPVAARDGQNSPKKQGYAQFPEIFDYPRLWPLSTKQAGFDKALEPSDDLEVYIPLTQVELAELAPVQIGFFDSFGRKHLCKKSEINHLKIVASAYFKKVADKTALLPPNAHP